MYLHNDKVLFQDIIREVSASTGIAQSIIEKDYYVTMILLLLAKNYPDIVFKGGTSLSKCYHLIDRFSEDIDITFTEHIGESRRKKLKYSILKPIGEELGMPIKNWDNIQSDKDYNCYLFGYQSISDYPLNGILSDVKLETALVSYSFPTEIKEVGSIIYDSLKDSEDELIADYALTPFSMKVQSITRTFIDKIFALCDYYIDKKSSRYSRHLYDLHKLYPFITIDDSLKELAIKVREHRSQLAICPSAKEGIDIHGLIYEFLNNDFYKRDYDTITNVLISDNVTYAEASQTLRVIADELFTPSPRDQK